MGKVSGIAGALALSLVSAYSQANHVMSAVNMMDCDLILVDVDSDQVIVQSLRSLPEWPAANCQHSWILPDRSKVFISTDATGTAGAKVAAIRIENIDWVAKKIDLTLERLIPMGGAAAPSQVPLPTQVAADQPIPPYPSAWFPKYSQIHGPTLRPNTTYSYLTGYTDSSIYVIDNVLNKVIHKQDFGSVSRQSHGIFFNPSGTRGLSAPYQFDLSEVRVYKPKGNGELDFMGGIPLGSLTKYAAFAHFVTWVDDRYAFVGTMQSGKTSLTPIGATIIGPSIWRLDTKTMEAKKIIGPTAVVNGNGIYRPASDVAVVGNTLIVAEEDTLDGNVGPGYVSFFDITSLDNPYLIKRLKPGVDLPADFKVAHVISMTADNAFAYVSSYYSNHILKIDVVSKNVVKVFDHMDGLMMPHGEFISENIR